MKVMTLLIIASGGAFGAVARYLISHLISGRFELAGHFPLSTMIINVSGSLFIGALSELTAESLMTPETRFFLMTGFLGAYTTFSTFTLETVSLLSDGEFKSAGLNILISNTAGVIAVIAGIAAVRIILKYVR